MIHVGLVALDVNRYWASSKNPVSVLGKCERRSIGEGGELTNCN